MNRGYSGFTAAHILTILPDIFADFDAKTTCGLVFSIGSNDVARDVTLEEYTSDVKRIVGEFEKNWGKSFVMERVLFVTPPRINDLEIGMSLDARLGEFCQAFLEVARENSIACFDWYKVMHDEMSQDEFEDAMTDGVHYATPGATLLYQKLMPLIRNQFNI